MRDITIKCNLCHETIRPQVQDNGFALKWTLNNLMVLPLSMERDCENHICRRCIVAIVNFNDARAAGE